MSYRFSDSDSDSETFGSEDGNPENIFGSDDEDAEEFQDDEDDEDDDDEEPQGDMIGALMAFADVGIGISARGARSVKADEVQELASFADLSVSKRSPQQSNVQTNLTTSSTSSTPSNVQINTATSATTVPSNVQINTNVRKRLNIVTKPSSVTSAIPSATTTTTTTTTTLPGKNINLPGQVAPSIIGNIPSRTTVKKQQIITITPEEADRIVKSMPNISISGITPNVQIVTTDIHDLLHKQPDESPETFEARRRLSISLSNIPNYKINPVTCCVIAGMMMNKSRTNVSYGDEVERVITYITQLL